MGTEQVKHDIESRQEMIGWLNSDIEAGNTSLKGWITDLVRERMKTVEARSRSFQDLADAIGAELVPNDQTRRRIYEAPKLKQTINRLRRPTGSDKPIPRLDRASFSIIMDVIEAYCVTFERSPKPIAKLEEEEIRDLLLASLNGAFNLGARGEAFSKHGKTDILLEVPDGAVFIAELKFWAGPATVGEVTAQIRRYLTWRDSFGLVVVLSRNRDFSGVRQSIGGTLEAVEQLLEKPRSVDQHHWTARVSLESGEPAELHYLLFDVAS